MIQPNVKNIAIEVMSHIMYASDPMKTQCNANHAFDEYDHVAEYAIELLDEYDNVAVELMNNKASIEVVGDAISEALTVYFSESLDEDTTKYFASVFIAEYKYITSNVSPEMNEEEAQNIYLNLPTVLGGYC